MTRKEKMTALATALDPKVHRAVVITMGEDHLADDSALLRIALTAAAALSEKKLNTIAARLAAPTS